MANDSFGYEIANQLFGLDKIEASAKLKEIQDQLQAELQAAKTDAERQRLQQQIQNLPNIDELYANQGLLDENGKLKSVQSQAAENVDIDYLNYLERKNKENEAAGISAGLRENQKAKLSGQSTGMSEIMAAVDAIKRKNTADLTSAVKGEKELAYGKTAQDVSRRENYARTLSDSQRQNAILKLNTYLTEQQTQLGLTQAQVNNLQQQLENAPDGLLQQLLASAASIGGQAIMAALL